MIDTSNIEYACLINEYPAKVTYDNLTFRNAEVAFQAQRLADKGWRKKFENFSTPEAVLIGKKLKKIDKLDDKEEDILYDITKEKMKQNPEILNVLLRTAPQEIVCGNYGIDTKWGYDLINNKGENKLGKILMKIREEFINDANRETATTD